MLATFGLERLEAGITHGSADSAKELAKLLEAAPPHPALRRRAQRSDVSTTSLVCRPGNTYAQESIRNFGRLRTPIVCSVGSLMVGLPLHLWR